MFGAPPSQPLPSAVIVAGCGASFYSMSLTVRTMPLGVVYAVQSGVGVVLTSIIGWVAHGQRLDPPALGGLARVVAGVLAVNLLSDTVGR